MIKRWIITGDTHGQVESRLSKIIYNMDGIIPEETAVIILGDAGINYYLNKTDRKKNNSFRTSGFESIVSVVTMKKDHRISMA